MNSKTTAVAAHTRVVSATARIGTHGLATSISMPNDHELRADEPEWLGGTDTGPTPMDLMLAGLVACKAMTIRGYADRKGWPLVGSTVRAVHRRVKASAVPDIETSDGLVDVIDCEIELIGPELTDDQRQRLFRGAETCNVHRCLTQATRIHTCVV